MSTTIMTMTNDLPHDVIVDILSRLPVKSLLRLRFVCKTWNSIFNDPSFIKMHLNHSINNYQHLMLRSFYLYSIFATDNNSNESLSDEIVEIDYPFKTPTSGVEILGSCNGLFLITPYEDIFCIWNPSTKEFKKLPPTPIELAKKGLVFGCRSFVYGFGYDKITEDYKVVRVILFDGVFDDESGHSEVKIYTLGSDSWRRIQDIPYHLTYRSVTRVAGKLVNGALHWVGDRYLTPNDTAEERLSYIIVSFNIEDEKYREIPQPNYTDDNSLKNVEVLGGCLCIVCSFCEIRSEIWVMKDYGVTESWTKLFTIAQPIVIQRFEYVKPIKFTNNGEVLFEKNNTSLVVYDPKHGTAKSLKVRDMLEWFETHTYVESLISPNSDTFVGTEQAAWKRTLKNQKKKDKNRVVDMDFKWPARG